MIAKQLYSPVTTLDALMIRKVSSHGIGYSVADLDHARYIFAAALPRQGSDLAAQATDALSTIHNVLQSEGCCAASIVQQSVFISDHDEIDACKQIMRDFYGDDLPATTYVVQPPCDGKLLAIEAWGVCQGSNGKAIYIERVSEHLVIVRHGGVEWAHVAGIVPQTDASGVYARTADSLRRMRDILATRGFTFDQVIRTWFYLGDIVGPEGDTQRYKELNR
ncbi:MAG: hypothetical protein ISS72_11440, partial [Candidatus Brocadiae bacterium]|nr:hypothetical protein [Candidatus Brocadiia bacterium]